MVTIQFLTMVAFAEYPLLIGAGLDGNCKTHGSSFDTDGNNSPNTKFLIGGTTMSKTMIKGESGCYTESIPFIMEYKEGTGITANKFLF